MALTWYVPKRSFEISGDGGEASAIHADENAGDQDEERDGVEMRCAGDGENPVEDSSGDEEDHVGGLASDEVGDAGPEEASEHVEKAEDTDEAGSGDGGDVAVKEILNHGRGLFEDADAGGHVQAEDQPQEPELRRAEGGVDLDVMRGDKRRLMGFRDPSGGFPAFLRDADSEDSEHHEDEVENAHGDPCSRDGLMAGGLVISHKSRAERGADHGTAAETHDGEAGSQAGTVGKPLDQRGDGRDVSQAEADAADDSVAEVDEREGVYENTASSDDESAAKAGCGNKHGFARAGCLKPFAEERC